MTAIKALLKREFLEHRGAFLYAPIVLIAILAVTILFAASAGHADFDGKYDKLPAGFNIYTVVQAIGFALWSGYLHIALFFYYADSFSADRKHNSLLFWKSMPQSDLKILAVKALAGPTVFLGLIFVFALITGLISYSGMVLLAIRHPVFAAPGILEAAGAFVQMALVGATFLVLTLCWYAPMLAWVAGLSTIYRGWSIPLAFLIPAVIVLLETMISFGGLGGSRPIGNFLRWRMEGILDKVSVLPILTGEDGRSPLSLIGLMIADVNWLHMALGLLFTAGVVYLASEYRRRRLEA